jgi:hypothetical protein
LILGEIAIMTLNFLQYGNECIGLAAIPIKDHGQFRGWRAGQRVALIDILADRFGCRL